MPSTVCLIRLVMSAYPWVVTSPATCTCPVAMRVSTATREDGSWASRASRMPSLIWSAILSGCPSVTDSEVKRLRVTGGLQRRMRLFMGGYGEEDAGQFGAGAVPGRHAGTDGASGNGSGLP